MCLYGTAWANPERVVQQFFVWMEFWCACVERRSGRGEVPSERAARGSILRTVVPCDSAIAKAAFRCLAMDMGGTTSVLGAIRTVLPPPTVVGLAGRASSSSIGLSCRVWTWGCCC